MNSSGKFLLDTNIFVQAHNEYYPFDLVPSFWTTVRQSARDGLVQSIDWVKKEIDSYGEDDDLKVWANSEFGEWFVSTDRSEVFQEYRQIAFWVTESEQYLPAAKSEFLSIADSWLIASAKAFGHILVTHEKYDGNVKKRVPIPNVCDAFNIPYMNTFDMLRRLRAKF